MEYEKAITEKHIFNYLIKHREMLLKNDMIVARDFFKIPKAENTGVLVGQKKDFTPHFVELISD